MCIVMARHSPCGQACTYYKRLPACVWLCCTHHGPVRSSGVLLSPVSPGNASLSGSELSRSTVVVSESDHLGQAPSSKVSEQNEIEWQLL